MLLGWCYQGDIICSFSVYILAGNILKYFKVHNWTLMTTYLKANKWYTKCHFQDTKHAPLIVPPLRQEKVQFGTFISDSIEGGTVV